MRNRNRLKKTGIFLLIVTLTVTCFTGCGKKESKDDGKVLAGLKEALENKNEPLTPSPGAHSNDSNEPLTPSPGDHFPEGIFAEAFQGGEVENNGDLFIRVGDKVYYRVYNERALERTTLGGTIVEKDDEIPSELHCYDLTAKEESTVCMVSGTGKLYAVPQGICLGKAGGYGTVLIPMDGSDAKDYLDGKIEAVSDDGRMTATYLYPESGGTCEHILYRDGEKVTDIRDPEADHLEALGFAEESLILLRYDYTDATYELLSYDGTGRETHLGQIDAGEDGNEHYGIPECKGLLVQDGEAYLLLAWYEGTGHFLSGWDVYRTSCEKEGDLQSVEMKSPSGEHVEEAPELVLDTDGKVTVSYHPAGSLRLSEDTSGDLIYEDGSREKTIAKNLIYTPGEDERFRMNMESAVVLGKDTAFVLLADVGRDELGDVGWRYAYDLYSLQYMAISFAEEDLDGDGMGERKMLTYLGSSGWGDGDFTYEALVGTWDLYSYLVEGYYALAEEEGQIEQLIFRKDGTVEFVRSKTYESKETVRKLERIEPEEEDSVRFRYRTPENEDNALEFAIMALKDDKLDVSITYYYDDGTPGGYNGTYLRKTE
ncbi:MAG: hypothetical protein K6D90_11340 [Lachnospiraceae bacterium]|nr:hypothetical protein [Lachnospiraceae bacterium]